MPDFMLILALIGVFGFVALVVGALAYTGIERAPGLRQRLKAVAGRRRREIRRLLAARQSVDLASDLRSLERLFPCHRVI